MSKADPGKVTATVTGSESSTQCPRGYLTPRERILRGAHHRRIIRAFELGCFENAHGIGWRRTCGLRAGCLFPPVA